MRSTCLSHNGAAALGLKYAGLSKENTLKLDSDTDTEIITINDYEFDSETQSDGQLSDEELEAPEIVEDTLPWPDTELSGVHSTSFHTRGVEVQGHEHQSSDGHDGGYHPSERSRSGDFRLSKDRDEDHN